MGTSPGDFGKNPNMVQCTAMSRRSGERCKGPAVLGSTGQKCRMHGGHGARESGTSSPSFKHGRHSKYLPSQLDALYRDAISNPDLLELADHIALLEARIQSILLANKDGDPVPRWQEIREMFDTLATAILAGDQENTNAQLALMFARLESGIKWDTTWDQVGATLESLRKLTDTEVKRKKELNQMVPIERVVILMAAVGNAVKRNVSNPNEIAAVYRELAMLHGSDRVPGKPDTERLGPEAIVIDVEAEPGRQRRNSAARKQRAELAEKSETVGNEGV